MRLLLILFLLSLDNLICANEAQLPESTCPFQTQNGVFCRICKPGFYCPLHRTGDHDASHGSPLHMTEIICPPGFYCSDGIKIKCPAGTFGAKEGISNRSCEGVCPPGYYCEEGTVRPKPCGNRTVYCPQGSSSPIKVSLGKFTYNSSVLNSNDEFHYNATMSWQKDCDKGSYCFAGVKHPCPAGTYNPFQGKKSIHDCMKCRRGWYCESGSTNARQFPCGGVEKYCPDGASEPLYFSNGYYTTGGEGFNESAIYHRISQEICPRGFYCTDGWKFPCPEGRFGDKEGLVHEHCTGFCPAGFYCPESTSEPVPCPHNSYASAGWHFCVECESKVEHERCKTHRNCCHE